MKKYFFVLCIFIFFISGCVSFTSSIQYYIGDIGPGGGYIFYTYTTAIGRFYLEAGPEETERVLNFGKSAFDLQLSNGGGHGSSNTSKLARKFRGEDINNQNNAIIYCEDLVYNDFDDWYLPSVDELMQIYINLYMNDIGNFKQSIYWSSYHDYLGAHYVDFSNGQSYGTIGYEYNYFVRPIRIFKY
jgi:hypothetical protein